MAQFHPSALAIVVNNIQMLDLFHVCQFQSGSGSAGPTIVVSNIGALVGSVVEQILDVGAVFLVVLYESALSIGDGICLTAGQAGVSVNIGPHEFCKGQELFVGHFAAKSSFNDLFAGGAVETITKRGGKCCGQILAVGDGAAEHFLCNGQSTKLGPSLPVCIKCTGGLVGIDVAIGDEDNFDIAKGFVVVSDVLSHTGKTGFTVGGRTTVQQVAGQFTQCGGQFSNSLDMNKNLVVAHTECHQGQLGVAAAIQNSLADSDNGFLHCGPFVVHGVGAVHHQDNFIMDLLGIAAGNFDGNVKSFVANLFGGLISSQDTIMNLHNGFSINRCCAHGYAYHILRYFTACSNTVAIHICGLGSIEVNASFQILSAGNSDLNLIIFHCLQIQNIILLSINLNFFNTLAIDENIEHNLIVSICAVIQFYIQFYVILPFRAFNLRFYDLQLGDDDLILLSVNLIQVLQVLSQSQDTLADFIVNIELTLAQSLDHSAHFSGIIVCNGAPLGIGGNIEAMAVLVIKSIAICIEPNSSLNTGNNLSAVQICSTFHTGGYQIGLHLFQRNIGIGVGDDGADMCGLFCSVVVTVFQIQALIVNTVFITGLCIAAIQYFVIAYAKGILAIGSPGVILVCRYQHQGLGNLIVYTAIDANHMVAHFVSGGGAVVNGHEGITVLTGLYVSSQASAVPNSFDLFVFGIVVLIFFGCHCENAGHIA